ncbi:MAG: hypothetical protein GXY67_08485 [Clostridiales bacterium]|nr:hypothetical protein [Clostridiales bacterium]
MDHSPTARKKRSLPLPSKRLLAWLCALLLAASTLPLYVLSLYNHPYYDDYQFSADVHAAWSETRSLQAVLQAALKSAASIRASWQGTYTGTILSNLQPGVFSESLYFLTTFVLLTAFVLCFGFFLKVLFGDLLGLDRPSLVILISLTLTLLVQLMPDPDEAFFWFNGGIGNTFIYSLLVLSLGLCARLLRTASRGAPIFLTLALLILMVLLGGGSYGGGLFGLCLYLGLTAWAFVRRWPKAPLLLMFTLVFLGCFLYNMSAPGNAVRAGVIASSISPVKAVAQALYYGTALAGSFLSLPLLGVTALVLPFLYTAAKASPFSFSHPWLWLLGGLGLFCTQLVPPLYGGVFIGGGRIVDTYWLSFVVLWLLYAFYLTGFALRRLEKAGRAHLPASFPAPVKQGLVLASALVLVVGCLGYKRPADKTYGLPNLAGMSAALSIVTGEARQYDREMTAREVLLNDASQPEITLSPLSVVPELFMKDQLTLDAGETVRLMLQKYYGKTAIHLAGEEAAP